MLLELRARRARSIISLSLYVSLMREFRMGLMKFSKSSSSLTLPISLLMNSATRDARNSALKPL